MPREEYPWLTVLRRPTQATQRLICFPYAGGGSNVFRRWLPFLPAQLEILVCVLPGRDDRIREIPISDAGAVVTRITQELNELPPMDTTFFGHSLGALIASLVLSKYADKLPCSRLIVSACNAPHVRKLVDEEPAWKLSDNLLTERLAQLNGTPKELLEAPEHIQMFLPLLRGDFKLADELRNSSWRGGMVPITVFFGKFDGEVTQDGILGWGRYSSTPTKFQAFEGDHFFVNSHAFEVCKSVERELS